LPVIQTSHRLAALLVLALSACTSLAPFQTVTPGVKPPPPVASDAIPVFGTPSAINNAAIGDEGEQPPASETEAMAASTPPAGNAAAAETPATPSVGAASTATSPVRPLAICYSRLTASAEQVRSIAEAACPGGTLSLVGQGWNLNVCPVFTPVRAVFTCTSR
jgi:hypothetical protein